MSLNTSQSDAQIVFSVDVKEWLRRRNMNERFPSISEPREIACYSKDDDGEMRLGNRHKLRRYVNPSYGTNLNDGYETFVPKRHDGTEIERVARVIKALAPSTLGYCNIVTYRNNLNKIGRTPSALSDGWELDCCQVEGVVFLDIRVTQEDPTAEHHRRATYQGYRFEAVCTNEEDKPVNPNGHFCSISELNLVDHCIVVSSEIDCTFGDPTSRDNPIRQYVELKTCKELRNDRDYCNMLRYRYPKYWLQSFLAGVPTIVVGIRSNAGILMNVKTLETRSLPFEANDHLGRRRQMNWDPAVMVNFIDHILTHIREACARNLGATIRLAYIPNDQTIYASLVDTSEMKLARSLEHCLRS